MLRNIEKVKAEWGGTLNVIDGWLANRQQLVVLYCKLVGTSTEQQKKQELPSQKEITNFCQTLLDYTSTGHFGIYEQIILQCKLDGEQNLKIAQELYSRITTTTDTALNFNDKYAENATEIALLDFDDDLSELGQKMEERFEREDQLLEVLMLHNTLV